MAVEMLTPWISPAQAASEGVRPVAVVVALVDLQQILYENHGITSDYVTIAVRKRKKTSLIGKSILNGPCSMLQTLSQPEANLLVDANDGRTIHGQIHVSHFLAIDGASYPGISGRDLQLEASDHRG